MPIFFYMPNHLSRLNVVEVGKEQKKKTVQQQCLRSDNEWRISKSKPVRNMHAHAPSNDNNNNNSSSSSSHDLPFGMDFVVCYGCCCCLFLFIFLLKLWHWDSCQTFVPNHKCELVFFFRFVIFIFNVVVVVVVVVIIFSSPRTIFSFQLVGSVCVLVFVCIFILLLCV